MKKKIIIMGLVIVVIFIAVYFVDQNRVKRDFILGPTGDFVEINTEFVATAEERRAMSQEVKKGECLIGEHSGGYRTYNSNSETGQPNCCDGYEAQLIDGARWSACDPIVETFPE